MSKQKYDGCQRMICGSPAIRTCKGCSYKGTKIRCTESYSKKRFKFIDKKMKHIPIEQLRED